jgi:uncharacterized membrane protein
VEEQQYNQVTGSPELTNQAATAEDAPKTKVLGLDYKAAGFLCYLPIFPINLIASLIIINSEPKENTFLRFHAMQSLVMMIVFMVAAIANSTATLILSFIPFIGGLIATLVSLAFMGVAVLFFWQSVLCMIAASKGETKHIRYIGQIAEERLAQ